MVDHDIGRHIALPVAAHPVRHGPELARGVGQDRILVPRAPVAAVGDAPALDPQPGTGHDRRRRLHRAGLGAGRAAVALPAGSWRLVQMGETNARS